MSTDADELTYIKTDAGNREVKSRVLKLPQRVRTMLILVDGTSTEAQLRDAAARMSLPGRPKGSTTAVRSTQVA